MSPIAAAMTGADPETQRVLPGLVPPPLIGRDMAPLPGPRGPEHIPLPPPLLHADAHAPYDKGVGFSGIPTPCVVTAAPSPTGAPCHTYYQARPV